MSVDATSPDGQAPTLRLAGVELWRWNALAGARVPILAPLDWEVRPGETWALLGPNGAGKTTLLTVAGAVEFPSRGSVELFGGRLGRGDVQRLRERIGHVDARAGERFAPGLTVEHVVQTGATRTIGYFPDRLSTIDRARAAHLVTTLGVSAIANRRFTDCSHGERTRALVARALVGRPRVLLLDEPGAGLDLPGRETLLAALDALAADEPGLAIVFTTHHLEELPASTTHALLLRDGHVLAAGPVSETLTDAALGACFDLPVRVTRSQGRWSATADA